MNCKECKKYACEDSYDRRMGRHVNKKTSNEFGGMYMGLAKKRIEDCPVLSAIKKGVTKREAVKLIDL